MALKPPARQTRIHTKNSEFRFVRTGGVVKSHTTYSSLIHAVLSCLSLFSALALLVPASHAQDVPSGFMPGLLSNYAGTGSSSDPYSPGSLPTQVSTFPNEMTATDSQGNVYIAITGSPSQALYIVYGGKSIPGALAQVATNPQAGRIYQIASSSGSCGGAACEGQPLNQQSPAWFCGLAMDSQDNLYYCDGSLPGDYWDDVVRKVDYATSNVTTVAGQYSVASPTCTTSACLGDGGLATNATLNAPYDIKLDSWGNLYILDTDNAIVRVVYSGSQPPPILAAEKISNIQKSFIYTVAGTVQTFCSQAGAEGCGDLGPALSAQLDNPTQAIGVDAAGNLYIADRDFTAHGGYIRMVYAGGTVPAVLDQYLNPTPNTDVQPTPGTIYPVTGYGVDYAGCKTAGCGDGGLAANVEFGIKSGYPQLYITLDDLGNLYIADWNIPAVRKIDASGYASTIAGIESPTQPASSKCPALPSLAVGSCLIDPSYISFDAQNNLYISDSMVVWKVAPLLAQDITLSAFNPSSVTYGVNPIPLKAVSSSTTPITYSVTASTPAGIGTINGAQLIVKGAGSLTVAASQPQTNVYLAASSNPESLTISKASLTVTANNLSLLPSKFNPSNPGFTAKFTGFVNGDAGKAGVYSGTPAFTTNPAITNSSSCGVFSIIPSIGHLTSNNYNFVRFIPGTLTITGTTPQTINFPAFSSTVNYGHGPIALSATTGSKGPVTFTVLSGPGSIPQGASTLTITGAGPIVVQAIQEGTCAFAASPTVTRTLTVNPAPLTVTGPNVKALYGTVLDPTIFPAAAITGFIGKDSESSVLTGSADYHIASVRPNAGTYPIAVTQGTLTLDASAATNYTFAAFMHGKLVVDPIPQTINFNSIASTQTYGNLIQMTATATSDLPVTFTTSGPARFYNNINSTIMLSGVGTVTVTAKQAGNNNYTPAASVTQTLQVNKAPLNIVVSGETTIKDGNKYVNYVREQGATNPIFTYQVGCNLTTPGCFVNNDTDIPSVISGIPVLTTTATQDSSPGVYAITMSQGTLAANNYYFVLQSGLLAVTSPGSYVITTTPASLTIPRGQVGQAYVTITPSNYYQGTVTLSCGSLPANVSCVISPSTFTFPGSQNADGSENPAQGTIVINTATGTIVGALPAENLSLRLAGLFIPGFIAGLYLAFARKRAAKFATFWRLCILLALGLPMIAITSCGGNSTHTSAAPGTVTVIIAGSGTTPSGSSNVFASVPLTVTIR
jgi:hypothetical protein